MTLSVNNWQFLIFRGQEYLLGGTSVVAKAIPIKRAAAIQEAARLSTDLYIVPADVHHLVARAGRITEACVTHKSDRGCRLERSQGETTASRYGNIVQSDV